MTKRHMILLGCALGALSAPVSAEVYKALSPQKPLSAPGGSDRDVIAMAFDPGSYPSGRVRLELTPGTAASTTAIVYDQGLREIGRATSEGGAPAQIILDIPRRSGGLLASGGYFVRVVPTGGAYDMPAGTKYRRSALSSFTNRAALGPYTVTVRDMAAVAPVVARAGKPGAPAGQSPPDRRTRLPFGDLGSFVLEPGPNGFRPHDVNFLGKQTLGKRNRGSYPFRLAVRKGPTGKPVLYEQLFDSEWGECVALWSESEKVPGGYVREAAWYEGEFIVAPDGSLQGRGRLRNENHVNSRFIVFRRVGNALTLRMYKGETEDPRKMSEEYIFLPTASPAYETAVARYKERQRAQKAAKAANGGGGGIWGMVAGAVVGGALTNGSAEGIMAGAQAFAPNDAARAQLAQQGAELKAQQERQARDDAAFQARLRQSVAQAEAQRRGQLAAANPAVPARAPMAEPAPSPRARGTPPAASHLAAAATVPDGDGPRYFECFAYDSSARHNYYGVVTSAKAGDEVRDHFRTRLVSQYGARFARYDDGSPASCFPHESAADAQEAANWKIDRDRGHGAQTTGIDYRD